MITKEAIEEFITHFPIYQYAFIKPENIEHSDKVRMFCKRDCPRYDTNWSCPPAVAKVSKCRLRCAGYEDVLLFSSVGSSSEQKSKAALEESKQVHEELTRHIEDFLINNGFSVYTLTSDACTICPKCTFPHEYCRHAELMHPCIESHGIVISELAEKCSMDYNIGRRVHLWFSVIYYRETEQEGE